MSEDKTAPRPGCKCDVCKWCNDRIDRERRQAEDLEANYRKYMAGELVSRDSRE